MDERYLIEASGLNISDPFQTSTFIVIGDKPCEYFSAHRLKTVLLQGSNLASPPLISTKQMKANYSSEDETQQCPSRLETHSEM